MKKTAKAFKVKKPCANCPFRNDDQAIDLMPGRLEDIVKSLVADDWSTFQCHKTVHSSDGGAFDEQGRYEPSGNESMCAGAAAYLFKIGRPNIGMRLALMQGDFTVEQLENLSDQVIGPEYFETA